MTNEEHRSHSKGEMMSRKHVTRNSALVIISVTLALVIFALWQEFPWWVILCMVLSVLLMVMLMIVFHKFLKKMDK